MLCVSCSEIGGNRQRGPIILGDSSAIVTETDSQYLRDDVLDIGSRAIAEKKDEAEPAVQPKPDTLASLKDTVDAKKPSQEKGFSINFGTVQMVLAGLDAKEIKKQDPVKQDGVAYMLTSSDITKGKVVIYGAKEVTVKQRYQSRLQLRSALGMVDLRNLGIYTSDWDAVTASGNTAKRSFSLSNLDQPSFKQVNTNAITNATDKELRKRKTNNRTIQSWLKEVKKVRRAGDKPSEIILDNVQWQISGKDANGKPFQKTVRIDV